MNRRTSGLNNWLNWFPLLAVFILVACQPSDSTPNPQATQVPPTVSPVIPTQTPVNTPTLTGPQMDATKAADEAARQQTRVAFATMYAIETPVPPTFGPEPTVKPVADVVLGISGLCADAKDKVFDYANCWNGRIGDEFVFVATGAPKTNPAQGVVSVYTGTLNLLARTPRQDYNTPTQSGSLYVANVSWPHMTLIAPHDDNDPTTSFIFNLQTRTWEEPGVCPLYPVALNVDSLNGLQPHYGVHDTTYGWSSGNFGWLSWDGSMTVDTLATSLTPPGDSNTYTNPDNPADHVLSIGDWVLGRPEVDGSNSQAIESALSGLASSYLRVVVPVWNEGSRDGVLRYHVSGFVWASVEDYSLAEPNRITFRYWGPAICPDSP